MATWHLWLSWLALLGLVIILHLVVSTEAFWKRLRYLLIIGVLKGAGATTFSWYIYPFDWLGIESRAIQLLVLFICWSTVAVSIGLGFALVLGSYRDWLQEHKLMVISLFPAAFVLAEVTGSLFFSLYSLGPGSAPNVHFAFGHVGYALGHAPLTASVAQWGGVYFASMVITTAACALYLFFQSHQHRLVAIGVLVVLTIICFGSYVYFEQDQPLDLTITSINTQFDSELLSTAAGRATKAEETLVAVRMVLTANNQNYVILPEDSRFTTSFASPEAAMAFIQTYSTSTILIDSARVTNTSGEVVLRSYIYDSSNRQIYTVDKEYLVPSGEFIPYLSDFVLHQLAEPATITTITSRLAYRSGSGIIEPTPPNRIPTILFCSESVSPLITMSRLKNHQSSFIVHLVSHGWFNTPRILEHQTEAMLRMHAVASNRSLVVAANMSEGYLLTPEGQKKNGVLINEAVHWSIWQYEI